jgi:DNA-binding PadR family transcriptional regulator
MATGRNISNPLALAVLALLAEGPTHPYEMDFLMRARGLTESIKLNRGSLYTVVETLQRDGLIVPQETQREGRRPERTIYAITDMGRAKFDGWLRELLRKPAKEYPQFVAGLTFLGHIPRDEAVALLTERARFLDQSIEETQMHVESAKTRMGVPRLFLIEAEFALEQAKSELRWVRTIIGEINDGTLAWPEYMPQGQAEASGVREPERAATDAAEARDDGREKGGGSVQ